MRVKTTHVLLLVVSALQIILLLRHGGSNNGELQHQSSALAAHEQLQLMSQLARKNERIKALESQLGHVRLQEQHEHEQQQQQQQQIKLTKTHGNTRRRRVGSRAGGISDIAVNSGSRSGSVQVPDFDMDYALVAGVPSKINRKLPLCTFCLK